MLWVLMSYCLMLSNIAKTACSDFCICKQEYIDCSSKQLTFISNELLLEFFHIEAEGNNVKTITHLNLANNLLKDLPMLVSDSLPDLSSLDLSNNSFIEVLSIQSVVLSKHLLHLKLAYNPIHHLGNNTDSVLYSQSISHLDLSHCNITSITYSGSFIYLLNLTYLDLKGNPLVVIDNLVSNSLRHLDLSRCMLGYIDKGIRDESMIKLSNLVSLNVSLNPHLTKFVLTKPLSNTILYLDASFCSLEKIELKPFPNLKEAILKGNVITILENNIFTQNTNLQSLDISENSIHHIEKFSFLGCKSLSKLDLSRNQLSSFDWNILVEIPQLQVLNISRNLFTVLEELPLLPLITIDASFCDISALRPHFLKKAVHIKHLNLSRNSLEYVDTAIKSSSLMSLDLSYCRISNFEDGTFTGLYNLKYLNLMGNRLTNPLKRNDCEELSEVKDLNLVNNLWHCDCNDPDFKYFWKYLMSYPPKIKNTENLICQSPKEYSGLTWERSCFEDLSNNKDSTDKNKAMLSVVVPLITMLCLVAVIFVIRQAYFSHQIDDLARDLGNARSTQNERRVSSRTDNLVDEELQRGILISLSESSQRSPIHELSKLPSYEEALLLPKPQSREDLQKIVNKYEETERFERSVQEDCHSQNESAESHNHPSSSTSV